MTVQLDQSKNFVENTKNFFTAEVLEHRKIFEVNFLDRYIPKHQPNRITSDPIGAAQNDQTGEVAGNSCLEELFLTLSSFCRNKCRLAVNTVLTKTLTLKGQRRDSMAEHTSVKVPKLVDRRIIRLSKRSDTNSSFMWDLQSYLCKKCLTFYSVKRPNSCFKSLAISKSGSIEFFSMYIWQYSSELKISLQ